VEFIAQCYKKTVILSQATILVGNGQGETGAPDKMSGAILAGKIP
jgi:hypothetical protein